MHARRLALHLLAPTVLVSVVLVGACTFGAFYLSQLHVNVARDLSENVQSARAATRLEATTATLIDLLRARPADAQLWARQVQAQNQDLRGLLEEAGDLANLEKEQELVRQIRAGVAEYLARWDRAPGRSGTDGAAELAALLEKEVLAPCHELRSYNTGEVERSDEKNRQVVQRLRWGLLAFSLGGPLGGLLLGYVVARAVRRSIYQLSVRIRDAAGRLNRDLGEVMVEEEGELPGLHRQMQGVTEEIERVVGELQQREREVLRAEQLAAVGQVAAGVAHELRNPLTSVKMLVQTGLEGPVPPGLPAEDLEVIESEIRRMEQCIRLFLDFARPPDSERRRADLGEVVRRAVALVEGRARRQKVRLDVRLPPEPTCLWIDPEQIHQVLVNLLLNALDALPRGGTVEVTLAGVPGLEAGSAEVVVRDSGPGISPRVRERLFEPFVSSKETGLGLGLSICKRLVEAHGGTIHGENARDGGAVFRFTLPSTSATPAPAAAEPAAAP